MVSNSICASMEYSVLSFLKIRGREAPTPEGRGQSKLSLKDLHPSSLTLGG